MEGYKLFLIRVQQHAPIGQDLIKTFLNDYEGRGRHT